MVEEREKPNSQEFYAASPNEFGHHLWSNAVYIVALLLSWCYKCSWQTVLSLFVEVQTCLTLWHLVALIDRW